MPHALRTAVFVKQVPRLEQLRLDADGRLVRRGLELEMNPYCRRGVSKAVELVGRTGGEVVVMTMGPPSAEDCLREAIAWGAQRGVLLSDPALAGSDTLATARALEQLLASQGDFDLVFVGRNSIDSDTGQVGPELAQLLGWPFAGPVRQLEVDPETRGFCARCESDDGYRILEGSLPVVLAVAERLCRPAKAVPDLRKAVEASRITRVALADLEGALWGQEASPTRVGPIRSADIGRSPCRLAGPLESQVRQAVDRLVSRGVFEKREHEATARPQAAHMSEAVLCDGPEVWAVVEPTQKDMSQELAQAAGRLAAECHGTARLVSLGSALERVPRDIVAMTVLAADEATSAGDFARALIPLIDAAQPWAVLLPSTTQGREVAARSCAALGFGLTGDAAMLVVEAEQLIAWKPAFGGKLLAAIYSDSDVQVVTVRPGVLGFDPHGPRGTPQLYEIRVDKDPRLRVVEQRVEDDFEALSRARVVIGVGIGVEPEAYAALEPMRHLLGAEMGATRRVTDRGWMPRSRQIGITGRSIAPDLYLAIGMSGKFYHVAGVRTAGSILAINPDPSAPLFDHADIGIVADWQTVVPLLMDEIRSRGLGRD